jgi:hypothetical protein
MSSFYCSSFLCLQRHFSIWFPFSPDSALFISFFVCVLLHTVISRVHCSVLFLSTIPSFSFLSIRCSFLSNHFSFSLPFLHFKLGFEFLISSISSPLVFDFLCASLTIFLYPFTYTSQISVFFHSVENRIKWHKGNRLFLSFLCNFRSLCLEVFLSCVLDEEERENRCSLSSQERYINQISLRVF